VISRRVEPYAFSLAFVCVSGLFCLTACAPIGEASRNVGGPAAPQEGPGTASSSRTPSEDAPERVTIIGDSLSTGFGTSPEDAWPSQLATVLQSGPQPVEITNASKNGSGYLTPGDGGETFASQIAESVTSQTNVVILFGSDNDVDQDPAELEGAVSDALAAAKARAPQAARIVIGPLSSGPPGAGLEAVRDEDRAAALAAGVRFYDPIAEQWIWGQDTPLLGPDGEHPSRQGQQLLTSKIEPILLSAAAP
jgi:acyl-CoA thioesterase I